MNRAGRVLWNYGPASGQRSLDHPSLALMLIAVNDDYNPRVVLIDPRRKRIVWQYGHDGRPGTSPGHLNTRTGWTSFPTGPRRATRRSLPSCAVSKPVTGGAARRRLDRVRAFGREHSTALAVTAIVAVAAIVRFATLGDQSLDHDEAVTAARVLHPSFLLQTMQVVNGEGSPPLYYILIWIWSRIFGNGAVDLRSLSAIFGTLTVVAAYLAGRELVSRRVGLIAAALVALNPYLIWYSQEARSCAALVMFGAFALYFFARSLRPC